MNYDDSIIINYSNSKMSNDPFPSIKKMLSEKIDSLELSTRSLLELRQVGATTQWNEAEIQNGFEEAQKNVNVLKATNDRVAANPGNFQHISPDELRNRQQFVENSQKRLNDIKAQLETTVKQPTTQSSSISDRKEQLKRLREQDNQRFIDDEFAYQDQMYAEQDRKLDNVNINAQDLNHVANQITTELIEDEKRRDDLNDQLDLTQNNLDRLIQKTKQLLDNPRTWLWAGCIVLTIIVIVLIIWVFVF